MNHQDGRAFSITAKKDVVFSNFDLTFEALNITNNALIDVDKYNINRGYETDGATVLLGARYRFH